MGEWMNDGCTDQGEANWGVDTDRATKSTQIRETEQTRGSGVKRESWTERSPEKIATTSRGRKMGELKGGGGGSAVGQRPMQPSSTLADCLTDPSR